MTYPSLYWPLIDECPESLQHPGRMKGAYRKIDEGADTEGNNRPACDKRGVVRLKPRERQIIVLRYFSQKTQTQIAQMLGISQVQVSRIEKKVLRDMRKTISI